MRHALFCAERWILHATLEKERLNKSALLERTLPGELWVWFRHVGGLHPKKDEADELVEQWGGYWSVGDKPE